MQKLFLVLSLILLTACNTPTTTNTLPTSQTTPSPSPIPTPHPMSIDLLRSRDYPTTPLTIEQTLSPGSNFQRYIASYQSDGYTIYGLLTIPNTTINPPSFPAIIFLHGYIPPDQYVTISGYVASQNGLASAGFITYKPDLRGHGNSQGPANGAHFSPDYVIDTINALQALKTHPDVDQDRIGIWGHSNGGEIGLRALVITDEFQAAVFWAGVVGTFQDHLETHNANIPFMRRTPQLVTEFGLPSTNPTFWNQIEPYQYLDHITTPIQLHHGAADQEVPIELSIHLEEELNAANKPVQLHQYPNADHNLSGSFTQALNRTIDFFNQHL